MTFFRSQRRFHLALLFAGLFFFALFTQLGVGWYQRQAAARTNLWKEVDQICGELKYSTRWELTRFRQSDLNVGHFYIIDKSGLLIEVEGFVPELGFRADLNDLQVGLQTKTVPITNETWRLMLKSLKGGAVILGISPPEDQTRVDERLQENALRFGKTLQEAEGTSPSEIDRFIEHAILDDHGRVKFALGGVPIKLLEYPKLPSKKMEEIHTSKGSIFGLLSVPFKDPTGEKVGTVTVFHEISPAPWLSLHAWLLNLPLSLMLAFVGTLIGARYTRDHFRPDQLLREALQSGECSTVEFKEALRWEAIQDRPGDARKFAETIAIRTIAGFLNSRLGGTLFIGIADDMKIVGLERDYESMVKLDKIRGVQDKDRDLLQLHLRKLLADTIGREVSILCVETAILNQEGKDVCIVGVNPSPTPVYVPDVKGKAFFLRDGASTIRLNIEDAVKYCLQRWPSPLWTRFRWRISSPRT